MKDLLTLLHKMKNIPVMKKIFKLLFFCLGLSMLSTSCGDSNNDMVNTLTFPECFAYVEDYSSSASAYYRNVSYVYALNYTQAKADITINNLKLTDGTTLASIRLAEIPWFIDNEGAIVIKSDKPITINSLSGDMTIANLNVRIFQRFIEGTFRPAMNIRYKVNQHFTVTSTTPEQRTYGTTTSTMQGGTPFSTKETYYVMDLDTETRQLKLTMFKAQFIDKMPAMDITISNIPFKLVSNKVVFEAEAKIPTIGGTPFDGFPITNLKGELDLSKGMTLNFDCRPQTMGGVLFHVTANTGFPLLETETK